MKTIPCIAVIVVAVSSLIGCGKQKNPPAQKQDKLQQGTERKPELTREEIMQRFKARASSDQLREFARLRAVANAENNVRALELVLSNLSSEDLFKIGITQTQDSWLVAGSNDKPEVMEAISRVLEPAHISAVASCDVGMCGWYVPREQFFRARTLLLSNTNLNALGVTVVTPRFSLD